MAQLVIDNLEDDLGSKLKELANEHGRSIEDEVRDILAKAVAQQDNRPNLGSRIAACFAGHGLEQDIPELRGHLVEPMSFDP
jgi:plasmid stability protein